MGKTRSLIRGKRILLFAMVAAAVIACLVWSVNHTRALTPGQYGLTVVSGNTIQISDFDDLNNLSDFINTETLSNTSYYVDILADIDAADEVFNGPLFNNNVVLTIRGNNHIIKNLVSDEQSCFINNLKAGSSVSDLGLVDCSLICTYDASTKGTGSGDFGMLWATMNNCTISNCFVKGSMTVYDSIDDGDYCFLTVGGLVGTLKNASADSIENSFALIDIDTNAVMTGGLVGFYDQNCVDSSIVGAYSTGYIRNPNVLFDNVNSCYSFVGGLVGFGSDSNNYQVVDNQSCYTTVIITNPSAGNIKSVGYNVNGTLDDVQYDSRVCLQRQEESVNQQSAVQLNGFDLNDDYFDDTQLNAYPVLKSFVNASPAWPAARDISYLSAACAYVDSTETVNNAPSYLYYPKLGGTAKVYIGSGSTNRIDKWSVSGGADEYYFNTNEPEPDVGYLSTYSGNFDYMTPGEKTYRYTSEGDAVFTAYCGDYSRQFNAHVTSSNPYFAEGDGSGSANAFIISNEKQLNNVRVFTLLEEYYYKIDQVGNLNELNIEHKWRPIADFRGSFNGNYKMISDMVIDEMSCEGMTSGSGAGLFANVYSSAGSKNISNLYLHEISIAISGKSNIGGVVGNGYGAAVSSSFVSGTITDNSTGSAADRFIGLIAGNNAAVSGCETTGYINAPNANKVGGIIGQTSSNNVSTCISTAVVSGSGNVGGIVGYCQTLSGQSGSALSNLIFAGMIKSSAASKEPIYNGTATATNCYYDSQTVGESTYTNGTTKTTSELTALSVTGFENIPNYYPQVKAWRSLSNTGIIFASDNATRAFLYKKQVTGSQAVVLHYRKLSNAVSGEETDGTSKLFTKIKNFEASSSLSGNNMVGSGFSPITNSGGVYLIERNSNFGTDHVFNLTYSSTGIKRYLMLTYGDIGGSGSGPQLINVTLKYRFNFTHGVSRETFIAAPTTGSDYLLSISYKNNEFEYNDVVIASANPNVDANGYIELNTITVQAASDITTSTPVIVVSPEGYRFASTVDHIDSTNNIVYIDIDVYADNAWGLDRIWWNQK